MMTTKQQDKQQREQEKQKLHERSALIGKEVIGAMGRLDNLYRVQTRWLWENYYRVNVLVGRDLASAKIAFSYFLEADTEGKIVATTPRITKLH